MQDHMQVLGSTLHEHCQAVLDDKLMLSIAIAAMSVQLMAEVIARYV